MKTDAARQADRHPAAAVAHAVAQWLASNGDPDWLILWIFAIGVVLMRSAGCVINDYADRDFDPHVARTRERPLATGKVSPKEPCCWRPACPCWRFC